MSTIKLVVIGASGVGKTSLRGQVSCPILQSKFNAKLTTSLQYISGRFSNGYRATIGADFITKTLPRPDNPSELVILQIWVNNSSCVWQTYTYGSLIFFCLFSGYCRAGKVFQSIQRVLQGRRCCHPHVRRERTTYDGGTHEMVV